MMKSSMTLAYALTGQASLPLSLSHKNNPSYNLTKWLITDVHNAFITKSAYFI